MRYFAWVLLLLALSVAACSGGSDSTPTPAASSGCAELQEGVFLCAASPPLPPPGATLLSGYYEVQSNEDTGLVVGLPLNAPQTSETDIGYYTFSDDTGWTGVVGAIQLVEGGTILQGTFPFVPPNIAVFRWPQGAASSP